MTKNVGRVMVLAFTLRALTIAVVAEPARRHSYVGSRRRPNGEPDLVGPTYL